jgi:hypothetical protein
MDDVARMDAGDRADLFAAAASRRALVPEIIEKDFWVCWTLHRLFTLPSLPAGLIFKGGTSLSKVYQAIERFSEDVDLSFDRAGLGFAGDQDPLRAASGKKKKRGVEALQATCQRVIRDEFLPQLSAAFAATLSGKPADRWLLEMDPDDPDQQTLLFHYPQSGRARPADEPAYMRPFVRLEMGGRAEHWPVNESTVTSYAAEELPHLFRQPSCTVRVLAAERTFWEKATILHAWYHAPAEKRLRDRQSRHYYDVARMYETGTGKAAVQDTGLLLKVAEHKEVFFAAPWAKYREARPGSLRLVPPDARLPEISDDYRKMREMIFGPPPEFDHLLEILREIERQINGS